MNNAFAKDVTYLKELYQKQQRMEELKEIQKDARAEEKRLKKSLAQQVKSSNDEKAGTIKKRKNEIAASYTKEIELLQSKAKRIENERESHKSKQQDKRYKNETKEMRSDTEQLQSEIKAILKKNRISRICRHNLYYTLFLPQGIGDHLVRLGWFLMLVLILPALVCYAGSQSFLQDLQSQTMFYALIFLVCFCFTIAAYLFVSNRTKMRFMEPLNECRAKIDQIRILRRQMKAVHKGIHKDTDESEYGLESYDAQLQDCTSQIADITANQEAALKDFEEHKQPVIEREIVAAYETAIAEISQKLSECEKTLADIAGELKDINLTICNEYEAYLGKENTSMNRVQELIAIMEEGDVATVGEAIAIYEKR